MRLSRPLHPRAKLLAAALLLPMLLWAGNPMPSRGADAGALQRQIDAGRQTEQRSLSAAARLNRLERQAAGNVAVLESRLSAIQAQAASWEARLARTTAGLRTARGHALGLRQRLMRDRSVLAETLQLRTAAPNSTRIPRPCQTPASGHRRPMPDPVVVYVARL